MGYKHILVAYDGSELAQKALEQAVSLVRANPVTQLTVLYAFHLPSIVVGAAYYAGSAIADKEYYEYAEETLDKARKVVAELPYTGVEMREGFPIDTILETAEEKGCDLIVMGSRGLSGLKELVLGSVSHAVVQKAKMPVLIVKAAATGERE